MRVLTVRQPWAWAIIHGGKDVENRKTNLARKYGSGPIAIHAALRFDDDARERESWPALRDALARMPQPHSALPLGVILGVVDLVDAHDRYCDTDDYPICSEWAEFDRWHLVLANPRPLVEPMPFRGALGLRTLSLVDEGHVLDLLPATIKEPTR